MSEKVIVFDLDGTLIDSGRTVATVLNGMRNEQGKPELPMSEFIPWLSLGGEQLITYALEVGGADVQTNLTYFRQQYFERPTPTDSLYAGVVEALETFSARAYRLSICTNKPRRLAEKVLKETRIEDYFSYICAGDDLPTRKPHTQNLKVCVEYFGLMPEHGIVVGDSCVDQSMADQLKMPFYFHRNGYDDGVKISSAHYAFDHYHQLLTEILSYE